MYSITSTLSRAAAAITISFPFFVQAQAQPTQKPPVNAAVADQARSSALTREQVRLEVERAMRDGTWRCRTSSRGWCSNETQVPANAETGKR